MRVRCSIHFPFLTDPSRKLPEVVLCSYDSSMKPSTRDGTNEHRCVHDPTTMTSFDEILLSNGIHKDPNGSSETNVGATASGGDTGQHKSRESGAEWPTDSPSVPSRSSKVRFDLRVKTEPRSKAIKIAPVDVSKLGNPRSRKPVIHGDLVRVSDLSFISNDDGSNLVDKFQDSSSKTNELRTSFS